ncbi:LytR/AlgR family response regulator transcription factor [Cohnella fermenti]|uniref:Response regulator transcription factor n=1 Tax=Cohnella fermenti TaxID=2565925 RepID=A0A4S4BJB9_9BACL|nr:LytTR family DNA-binding domain-containing protein [Cohnella fermenti]THF74752.1 response regulator transcription factor [Cohnella fermenti]
MIESYTVAIAEDVRYARILIRQLCEKNYLQVVAEASSGIEFKLLARDLRPDVLVLDIELEDMSGIELARQLRAELDYTPQIIFITGSTDPLNIMAAVNEVGAFYIVKPLQEDRWMIAITKVIDNLEKQRHRLALLKQADRLVEIHVQRKTIRVAEESILIVEKIPGRKNVNVYLTTGEVIESNSSLNQIKDQSSTYLFETIRGFLVNLRYVAGYRREGGSKNLLRRFDVYFHNSYLVAPLGRIQEKEFAEQLNQYQRQGFLSVQNE